ncbi:MAG: hypothetical protein AABM64_15965 [Pseudomonadota bacterium]
MQFTTLRFTLAALCMVPVIMKFRAPLLPRREQWPAVAILGLMLAGNFACTLTALRLGLDRTSADSMDGGLWPRPRLHGGAGHRHGAHRNGTGHAGVVATLERAARQRVIASARQSAVATVVPQAARAGA